MASNAYVPCVVGDIADAVVHDRPGLERADLARLEDADGLEVLGGGPVDPRQGRITVAHQALVEERPVVGGGVRSQELGLGGPEGGRLPHQDRRRSGRQAGSDRPARSIGGHALLQVAGRARRPHHAAGLASSHERGGARGEAVHLEE